MQNPDNPRDLKAPHLALLTELRKVFHGNINEFLIRFENHAGAWMERGDPLEVAQAFGTIHGATLAWGEILTPVQAKRLANLTGPLEDWLIEYRKRAD